MSKRKQKNNDQLLKELSLIIPAFSYIWSRVKEVDSKCEDRDVMLARRLARKLATITKCYRVTLQQKAIAISDKRMLQANILLNRQYGIEPETKETHLNIFLLGLSLIAKYHELQGKKIIVGMIDEIIELQDFAIAEIDADMIPITLDFADIVYDLTFTNKTEQNA